MTLFALVRRLKRQYPSRAAGFAAVTIAAAVLIGWWGGLQMLSGSGSAFAGMRPVTALCLAALGLALVHPGKKLRFAFAVGLAVAAVAVLDLYQDLFGFDFGIDRWLVPRTALQGSEAPSFRMINGMPVAIALAGGSLAFSRFEGHHFAATVLGVLAGGMALFALLAYLSGIDTLHGSASVSAPPLSTAVGVLCVASGIILRFGTMPALRTPRPLWHLLIMLGCAIIAPLLLFGFRVGVGVADTQLGQVRKDLTSEAGTLSANVDRQIIGEIEKLQALAASPSLRQGDFAEFQRQAEAALALLQIGNIVLVDRNMQQLVNTFVPFGKPLPKAVVPEPLERAFVTGKPQVTDLFMAPVVNQFMFGIIVTIEIDGESRYVLGRSQDQHAIARLVAPNELPTGWQAVVSDGAHRIIARSEHEDAFIGKELTSAQWHRAGPGRVFEFVDSKGRSSIEASARSELTGWETAVWAPKALLEAPVRALWWTIGFAALLAIALVVALALWLGRIIARSVDHAARAAVALGEGGQVVLGRTPVAEVNALMAELHHTTARRQAAEDWRHQSEAIFRAMFDVSSVGKIEVDPGTARILRANAAMCKLVGYTEAELLAKTALDITHPDDRDCSRELGDRQAAGELVAFDVEKRYIHKDGRVVWARTTVNVIPDSPGRPWRQTSVIQNITPRKQAEQDLQASKDRLQLAFDATRLGWWQYDLLHHIGSGDLRFKEIFDLTADEISIEDLMKRVHPDDAEKVWADRQAALDPANPKRSASEFRIRRRNGEIRWVEAHRLAYFEGGGPERRAVSFGGTVQDITERKEREEKEHLLMREINHRAKNMLSVVDAIAHQTATRNPEDFVERFSERIQALSANQDLLVRNQWNGVEIDDLVRAQLAHFADLIGSRIAMRGPKLRLNPASAQAIGLALHELATNAGKYGALSTGKGRVGVCWETHDDTLAMSWIERDGPPVSAPKRRGFGTIVMEAMTERSVNGTVDLDHAPSGLTCPAANALEPIGTRAKFQYPASNTGSTADADRLGAGRLRFASKLAARHAGPR
jgi:PAS domain S-box-containing protein